MRVNKLQSQMNNFLDLVIDLGQKLSERMNKEADSALIDLINLKIVQNLLTVIQAVQFHHITAIMEIQVQRKFIILNRPMRFLVDHIRFQIRILNGKLH